jgi:hypothetical protein
MSNTTNNGETMSHAQMMNARDGVAYLWIDGERRFAKLVRDGRTIARVDRMDDGSHVASEDGRRTDIGTWSACSAWLTARASAKAITSDLTVLA